MVEPHISKFFQSEGCWPFLLREKEIGLCLDFIENDNSDKLKLLQIKGVSGCGKSFFSKELVSRVSEKQLASAALYFNVPPADLDASKLFDKAGNTLCSPHNATKFSPFYVSKGIAKKWTRLNKSVNYSRASYLYGVARELTNQIPVLGPFIKAFLPVSIFGGIGNSHEIDAIDFLINESKTKKVIIVIDNTQFLPLSYRAIFESKLSNAGRFFTLVLVERTINCEHENWLPLHNKAIVKSIEFGPASLQDTKRLVQRIFPMENDIEELVKSIHRRSEGNLKSIWFQLKFLVERRENQALNISSGSYQGVVQSLSTSDTIVLRLVVFLLGGLSIGNIVDLVGSLDLKISEETVRNATQDLVTFGLLVLNSERHDKLRVEHELIAHVVSELTPEEEKLELRLQLVQAISDILDVRGETDNELALYDRLIGITYEQEVRAKANIQNHIVTFIYILDTQENFSYLANIFRDSVCWDVLDILPSHSVKIMLNAFQKCSLFSFGLIATEKLRNYRKHKDIANLFEAKFLVQLFRYEEAESIILDTKPSKERDSILFNIRINLCEDEKAASLALSTYKKLSPFSSEYDFLTLRNSGHLFPPDISRKILSASVTGFESIGSEFGYATALNNASIVELHSNNLYKAKIMLNESIEKLKKLNSVEVYQPYVNLSAIYILEKDIYKSKKYLLLARSVVPKSLAMDAAMLDFNELIIDLYCKNISYSEAVVKFERIRVASSRTKDFRFISVVSWFVSKLKNIGERSGDDNDIPFVDNDKVGIEVFFETYIDGNYILLPYILSPNWRY
ncbi:hypothetical protein [Pseudoalteromonas rubra]|uniref:Orc1-like AAA ATPase domain-containing protein n=1 Tax=Pseudoalteromonas rubra TaxID=43658 RepID=A0A0F4QFX2_9GAMM|nr:hypothetical protein [Pseudoalteromonas rubra]KJZ06481.1 hypothetical protein TW77_19110 [Pseudoalteromonas rubra]